MIIPQFQLSQDSKHVVIVIRIPYVKISNAEFFIDGRVFKFFLHPYMLTIELKNDLKPADEPASASYDHNTYMLTVKILKANEGEEFEDLDMITRLLVIKSKKDHMKKPIQTNGKFTGKKPLIEVIGNVSHSDLSEEVEELKTQVETLVLNQDSYAYGFNMQTIGYFGDLGEEIFELGHLNPDEVPIKDRINLRTEYINRKFDEDAYIYDSFENEEINDYLAEKLNFIESISTINHHAATSYNSQEWSSLLKLPNKEFMIKNKRRSLLELVDILFSFVHELRCMGGELSCESAATINAVSSVLSCFICDDNLQNVMTECYRRVLSLSMVRHFELAKKSQNDLGFIFKNGRVGVLKALLQIKQLFDVSEPRYHLNNLYIDDFCIWIQYIKDSDLHELHDQVSSIIITKQSLKLNLDEIDSDCLEMIHDNEQSL